MLLGRTAAAARAGGRMLQRRHAPRGRARRPGRRDPRRDRPHRGSRRSRPGTAAPGAQPGLSRLPPHRARAVACGGARGGCLPLHFPNRGSAPARPLAHRCAHRPICVRHFYPDCRRHLGVGLLGGANRARRDPCGACRRALGLCLLPAAGAPCRRRLSGRLFLSQQCGDRGGRGARFGSPERRDP